MREPHWKMVIGQPFMLPQPTRPASSIVHIRRSAGGWYVPAAQRSRRSGRPTLGAGDPQQVHVQPVDQDLLTHTDH
jgi:hypothetical protein